MLTAGIELGIFSNRTNCSTVLYHLPWKYNNTKISIWIIEIRNINNKNNYLRKKTSIQYGTFWCLFSKTV